MATRAERTELTQDWVIGELRKIAGANMADYMRANPGGHPYLDFSALSEAQTAAQVDIASIKATILSRLARIAAAGEAARSDRLAGPGSDPGVPASFGNAWDLFWPNFSQLRK